MKNLNDSGQTALLWQVTEIKVTYHNNTRISARPKINSSSEAEKVFRSLWSDDMELLEEFNALFLNRANVVKGILRLSRGGITGSVVDHRILFATALKGLSTGVLVAHSNPSGNLVPSSQDIELTNKLSKVGLFHDIPLIDHLILAPHEVYYSFKDDGRL